MGKLLVASLSVSGLILFGAGAYWSVRSQQATQRQIVELQEQVRRNAAAPAAPTASPTLLGDATTRGATLGHLEKVRQTRAALDEGWKLLGLRDPKEALNAVSLFREAIERVDDKNPQFWNGLGRAYLVAGMPQEALKAWRQGLVFEPTSAEMHSGMGWAYWSAHKPARARKLWEETLQLAPNSIDAWSALSWVYLAVGEFSKARDGFQILVAYNPKNNAWVQGLGMARAKNSDLEQIAKFMFVPPPAAFAQLESE